MMNIRIDKDDNDSDVYILIVASIAANCSSQNGKITLSTMIMIAITMI